MANRDYTLIEGAMAEEVDYIANGESSGGSLISRVQKWGFTTLDDYFQAKNSYKLGHIDFTVYRDEDPTGIDKRVWAAMEAGESCVWIPKLTNVTACVGYHDTATFDYDKATELGVDILDMPHEGGIIITGPDDLTIGVHFPYDHEISYEYFMQRMETYWSQYGLIRDGNDFMLNGYKVIGCSENINFEGTQSTFFFHLSFSDHTAIINQLCEVNPDKPVGYIPDMHGTKTVIIDGKEVVIPVSNRDLFLSEVVPWLLG